MRSLFVCVFVAAFLLGLGVAQAATIQNGDFEKGCDGFGTDTTPCATIPDWSVTSPQGWTNLVGVSFVPGGGVAGDLVHSGSFGVEIGDQPGAGGGFILQAVPTTPGAYTLQFWYRVFGCTDCIEGSPNTGNFNVFFDDVPVWSADPIEFELGTPTWQHVLLTVTASGTSADLMFIGANYGFDIGLDDVSLDADEIPEPGTLVLVGVPLVVAAFLRRRF